MDEHNLKPLTGAQEALLAEQHALAREKWPEIVLEQHTFARHVQGCLKGAGDTWETLKFVDLYLTCACLQGDIGAVNTLVADHVQYACRALAGMHLPAHVAEDLRAAFTMQLLVGEGAPPKLKMYRGTGSLRSWMRVGLTRMALNRIKRHTREVSLEDQFWACMPGDVHIEERYLKEHYQKEVKAALRDALDSLTALQRVVLKNYLIDKLSLDELASVHRIHRSSAARWVKDIREHIEAYTKNVLTQRLQLEGHNVESIIRMVLSGFSASFERLLQAP